MYALVTGASAGIGMEIAKYLAVRGYDLILTARRKDRLEKLRGQILAKYPDRSVIVIPADLSKRALAMDDLREGGVLLGPADETTSRKFDLLLWRLSRLADERSDTDMVRELTVRVRSLRGYADFVERLLPADRLILTPSEELDVTLKRADFKLAARAARAVLVTKPGDARAHFALGMNELEERGYGEAARHFEAVLAVTPDEPAVLNNLAVAYFRLGRKDEARELIEKALKLHPSSEQVRAVYREITGERPPAVR